MSVLVDKNTRLLCQGVTGSAGSFHSQQMLAYAGVGRLVVAPGLTRFHRAGCPSVAGLAVSPLDRRDIPGGLSPCRLCDAGSDWNGVRRCRRCP